MSVVRAAGLTFELDGEFREEVVSLFTAGAIDALPRLLVLVTPRALGLDDHEAAQATTEALLRESSGAEGPGGHAIELRAATLGGREAMEASTTLAAGARWRAWYLAHGAAQVSYLRVCEPDDEARVDAIAHALAAGEGWAAPACPAGMFDHSARTLRSTSGPGVQIELRARRTEEAPSVFVEQLVAASELRPLRLAAIDGARPAAELWCERSTPRGVLLEITVAVAIEEGVLLATLIAARVREARLEGLRAQLIDAFARPARP